MKSMLSVLVLVAAALGPAGCEKKPAPSPTAPTARPVASYTVRGVIKQLPDEAVKGTMLQVHHEAIPGFVNADGAVVGMKEMVMPFPLGPGVSLQGLAVGDSIEMTFDVDWSRKPAHRLSAIRKLAGGEQVKLEAVEVPH